MGIAASPRAGWAVAGLSGGVLGFWLVLGGPGDVGQLGLRKFIENSLANLIFAVAFPVVGALILSRIPGHRLGLLYCLCGLACSVTLASYSYAERGLVDRPGSLPGAVAAGWLSSWVWMLGFSLLLTLGVIGFPDGRLPGRRWWPVLAVTALAFAVGLSSIALRPGPLENHPVQANPLGLPLPRSWFVTVGAAWLPLLAVAGLASFAGLAVRYRRASAGEREQLRTWSQSPCCCSRP